MLVLFDREWFIIGLKVLLLILLLSLSFSSFIVLYKLFNLLMLVRLLKLLIFEKLDSWCWWWIGRIKLFEQNYNDQIERKLLAFEDKRILKTLKFKLKLGENEIVIDPYLIGYTIILDNSMKAIDNIEFIRNSTGGQLAYTIGFPLFFSYHIGFDPENNKIHFIRNENAPEINEDEIEEISKKEINEIHIQTDEKMKQNNSKNDTKKDNETKPSGNMGKKIKDKHSNVPNDKNKNKGKNIDKKTKGGKDVKKDSKKQENENNLESVIDEQDEIENKEKSTIKIIIDKEFLLKLFFGAIVFIILSTLAVNLVKRNNRKDLELRKKNRLNNLNDENDNKTKKTELEKLYI